MKYNEQELALLDMFAGQALNGILTSGLFRRLGSVGEAKCAFSYAEAMLVERKRFIE